MVNPKSYTARRRRHKASVDSDIGSVLPLGIRTESQIQFAVDLYR